MNDADVAQNRSVEDNVDEEDNALTTDGAQPTPSSSPPADPSAAGVAVEEPTDETTSNDELATRIQSDAQTAESVARQDWEMKQNSRRAPPNTTTTTSNTTTSNTSMTSSVVSMNTKEQQPQLVTMVQASTSPPIVNIQNKVLVAELETEERDKLMSSSTNVARKKSNPDNPDTTSLLGAVSVIGGLHGGSTHSATTTSIQQLRPVDRTSFINSTNTTTTTSRSHRHDDENGRDLEQQQQNNNNNSANNNNGELLLEATLVVDRDEHDDGHNSNNNTINNNDEHHQQDDVITTAAKAEQLFCGFSRTQLLYLGGCLVCLVTAVAVAVSLTVAGGSNNDESSSSSLDGTTTMSPTPTPRPTLEMIRDRGALRCGIWKESLDFFNWAETYETQEDQVDFVLCRAYAAAILGDASKHEIVYTTQKDNLVNLEEGAFDMLLSHVETGMQADVWESNREEGSTFTVPYVYTDFVYGGLPEYVACADDNMNARGNCSGLRICTNDNSVYFELIASKLPEHFLIKRNDTLDIVMGFVQGACNVMPSENSGIMEWGLELLGYSGDYARGSIPFQKDVATVATRDDDVEFSDFVNIILMGLFAADQANITKENAEEMGTTAILGSEMINAVRAVGSYKDVYRQGISPFLKQRSGWNLLNDGTTGLLYALSLGKARNFGPGPVEGGTLQSIWERNDRKLHCGIRTNRSGLASFDSSGTLVGLDVEFCTALAASLLEGEAQSIEFVSVLDEADGYRKLQEGEVDVLAGFTWNIVNDYREPTTGEGYSFSQPYFYRPLGDELQNASSISFAEDNRCIVSRQDDPQFSSFVFWVVAATFYAEEQGITRATANDMPEVNLFGEDYNKMFRDAIYFSGNYGEIYERNLASLLPERGRNAINNVKTPGPQLYVPPGFF